MNENRHICRAKRDPDGRWFEGYYVMLQGIEEPLHLIIDRTGQYIRIDPETVGECTGYLDVQGRLIYEGDIVKDADIESEPPMVVNYDDTQASYAVYAESGHYVESLKDIDRMEIIGNVHEEQMRVV